MIQYYESKNKKVEDIIPIIKIDGTSKPIYDGIVGTENLNTEEIKKAIE